MAKVKKAPTAKLKRQAASRSTKKSVSKVSAKKLTKAQSERFRVLLSRSPSIEKIDPQMYAKLQSAIHEAVEKTMPEYVEWLNQAFGETLVAEDCPQPACWSCGTGPQPACWSCGTGPTPVCDKCDTGDFTSSIDKIANKVSKAVINAAMSATIGLTLADAVAKESGIIVSEAQMRNIVKKQLKEVANEIGKGA